MPSFVSPHPRYQRFFLAGAQEILDAGEYERRTGLTVIGDESHTVEELADPDPALVTCDAANTASRRVIEFEDQREKMLRFWVPTS